MTKNWLGNIYKEVFPTAQWWPEILV